MTDWRDVACMACGWEQQHPRSTSIFAYRCDKCGCGSCVEVHKTKVDDPPKKEASDEGFMCQVQCKGCLADHNWSQAALNNQGFVCGWQKCGCTDYRLMGVQTPKEPPAKESVPDRRSTAPLDLDKLTRFELIDLIHLLLKDRHDFK